MPRSKIDGDVETANKMSTHPPGAMIMAGHSPVPECNHPNTWHGGSCGFPVSNESDRCYLHDATDDHPERNPLEFLERADHDPPESLREAIRDDPDTHGPILAEHFVRFSRRTGEAHYAKRLAFLSAEELRLQEIVLGDGCFIDGPETADESRATVRPELRRWLTIRREIRRTRRAAGLTAHDSEQELELDIPSELIKDN